MNLTSVGEVIATRRLFLTGEETREILVLIGKPQKFPDSEDYYCPFQVTGIGSQSVKCAGDVDSIQAVQLAVNMLGSLLGSLNKAHDYRLRWDAGEKGDIGFGSPGQSGARIRGRP